ncbi:MAG: hypothetical protein QOE55_7263, partial [Acidobacteriaceae bacterium]|nr:hypothetical protein [Acidobacteriaceae bacterium]
MKYEEHSWRIFNVNVAELFLLTWVSNLLRFFGFRSTVHDL